LTISGQDGALWVYPETKQITFKGLDALTEYTFAMCNTYHGFCKICGVAIRARFVLETSGGPEETALNVRTMSGLDLGVLKIERCKGQAMEPAYEG
jgi:hypothetical protein